MCIEVERFGEGNLDINVNKCRASTYWGKLEIWKGQLYLERRVLNLLVVVAVTTSLCSEFHGVMTL